MRLPLAEMGNARYTAEPMGTVPEPSSPPPTRASRRRGRRVLVVDDNPVNQKLLLLQLTKLAAEADAVGGGQEALDALASRDYGVVLMDCRMPAMDGYEATAKIRRLPGMGGRLPIVAMTAGTQSDERDRCLAAGMDDYTPKPVRLEDLARLLERWDAAVDVGVRSELRSLGGDDAFAAIVDQWEKQARAALTRMRAAAAADDREAIAREAHALKGSSGSLGAVRLSDLCAQMMTGAPSLETLLAEAGRELEAALPELRG